MMTSRECVLRAIRFEEPDYIPLAIGVDVPELLRYGQEFLDLCVKYPGDFRDPRELTIPARETRYLLPGGGFRKRYVDEWGSEWVTLEQGFSGEVTRPALADWSKLKGYRAPADPNAAPEKRRRLREDLARQKERYPALVFGGTLFQRMTDLRGMENCLMDIASDAEEIYTLADVILGRTMETIEIALEAGADIVRFADDWGTQTGLFVSPAAWRRIFKPRYRKMFDLVRQGGAIPWMHSCGRTMDLLDDWMEIGLQVLEPQLGCMDLPELRRRTDGRLCIDGTLDFQRTLPLGTSREIRDYIGEVRAVFGSPRGGFIYQLYLCDGPIENAATVLDAIFRTRALHGRA